ncbi:MULTISPECIES: hypothetical protein [unclassified Agarivorans]|uniref:hypothetical protein n=1 Tax=unclassified Agarivorans TaxID=2636026 RepID=UPI003D7E80F8
MDDLFAVLAGLYSPLQALLLLTAFYASHRLNRHSSGDVWWRLGLSLGMTYGLMLADNYYSWWPSLGLDYSTHTALAFSLQIALAQLYPRWRGLSWLAYGAYLWLMYHLAYHSLMDMLTSMLIVGLLLYLTVRCKTWLHLTK